MYPATDSVSEWGSEILALDHLTVEGFSKKGLASVATIRGMAVEKDWGSLKTLEVALVGTGIPEEQAKSLVGPLRELHNLRNPVKAHGDPTGREKSASSARAKFKSLRAHFKDLAAQCDVAVRKIAQALQEPADTE